MSLQWKPLVYRGVDYSDFYEVSNEGHIKRLPYKQISIYGYIEFGETIHKPEKEFNVVVKPLKIRKCIDVKRAVAENFMPRDEEYHFVLKYDDDEGNYVENLFWTNQPKRQRLPTTYNNFRERNEKMDREIVKMYVAGITIREIVEKFKTTRTYVRKAIDNHGIKREMVRNRRKYDLDIEQMKEMFEKKATLRQVAERFNISKYLASYYKGVLGYKSKTKIISNKEKMIYE
jgi:hypothetical protein